MSKLKASVLTAGSLALAVTGGAALAAGVPTGTPSAGVFSIDDATFDAGSDMRTTACPVGFTCTNLIGSTTDMVQREVVDDATSERLLQIIIAENNDVLGDGTVVDSFAAENQIRFDNTNNLDAKMIMDEQSQAFYTEQTMFRGANDPNGGFPQQETLQVLAGGFQTFEMTLTNIPNNNATGFGNNQAVDMSITQGTNPNSAAGVFAHRVLKGNGQVTDFDVSVFDGNGNSAGNIAVAGGAADAGLTATYIGQRAFGPVPGGAAQDFGVMIYRYWDDVNNDASEGVTYGSAAPTTEIRATSAVSSEEGSMFGPHGSFENNGAVTMGWDEGLFGTSPN